MSDTTGAGLALMLICLGIGGCNLMVSYGNSLEYQPVPKENKLYREIEIIKHNTKEILHLEKSNRDK